MKELNVYFDTEFDELQKNCNLISIGLVTDNNDYFYAEIGDYDKSNLNDWVKENVIKNLIYNKYHGGVTFQVNKDNTKNIIDLNSSKPITTNTNKKEVQIYLDAWFNRISNYGDLSIKLISDVCHYDMVLLADIFGGAMNMPKFVSPSCYDINQDIAKYLNINQKEAFDIFREDFCKESIIGDISALSKHNSLYDAEIIKRCYHILHV